MSWSSIMSKSLRKTEESAGHSMGRRDIGNCLRLLSAVACLAPSSVARASQYQGRVTFNGLPVPGATVTAVEGAKKFAEITDQQGLYAFPDLADGTWTIEVEMTGFSTIKKDVVIAPNMPAAKWELKVLPLAEIKAQVAGPGLAPANTATNAGPSVKSSQEPSQEAGVPSPQVGPGHTEAQNHKVGATPSQAPQSAQTEDQQAESQNTLVPGPGATQEELNQLASPGFLINGSVNNGAASPFAQFPAFGNFRNGPRGLYNGGLGFILDNSALDARPFSLSGQPTPKPGYNRITGMATLGGPLKIPHFIQNGPNFFVSYQWTRYLNDTTQSALVPDLAERGGDFSQAKNAQGQPVQIFDPVTGLPFTGNMILPSQISPQAHALLNFYPVPNFNGNARYNYQAPINSNTHQDALQTRLNKFINPKNQLDGGFAFQSARTAAPNLFGFLDHSRVLGINSNLHWSHTLAQQLFLNLGFQFSRLASLNTPYFENHENVSGQAGISGNNQDPTNWGPPSLNFASGIAGLSDGQASFNRNQTSAWSSSILWNRGPQNITLGGDFRWQEFNYLAQQNPRGAFTFTGAATAATPSGSGGAASGSDIADFLLGVPDTSSIAFGNADKYFRESAYDVYVNDDYRIRPEFTLNFGVRWEYGAPITELYGRLVNLDITPDLLAVAPVVATDPTGPLTGQKYPDSLIRPDKSAFEPRIGIAWRPIGGSSLVVRAGFGVYYNTSVYQTMALQMAQQAPLSKSLSVENSPACPLSLANGFIPCSSITPDNFAIDPNFRVGYAQVWNLSVQRDLPGSLQMTATYLGTKGTRGLQEFLPNTFPPGAVNPCPACPAGFAYFTSNGNSTREVGQIQLRRRLESGFTATVQYTYSKSIDDVSALGGAGGYVATPIRSSPSQGAAASSGASQNTPSIAQNWLNLGAERSLSPFDQRHLLNLQLQCTTGMGLGGGTLLSGWKGRLFKEWTVLTQFNVGSGLPETPIYLATVPGTGVTGTIRPDETRAPLSSAPAGLFLNPAAYRAPAPGQWGNAGRDSIIGPSVFSVNASLGRTFRFRGKYNLDFRVDSTNALNHVTYTGWDTIINSAQFGLPSAANGMRSLQTTLRLRF